MSTKDVKVTDLVSTKHAAEIIGCTTSWVLRMIRDNEIEGVVKFGPRQIFVPRKIAEKIRDNPSHVGRPRTNAPKKQNHPSTVGRPRKSAPHTRNAAAN